MYDQIHWAIKQKYITVFNNHYFVQQLTTYIAKAWKTMFFSPKIEPRNVSLESYLLLFKVYKSNWDILDLSTRNLDMFYKLEIMQVI